MLTVSLTWVRIFPAGSPPSQAFHCRRYDGEDACGYLPGFWSQMAQNLTHLSHLLTGQM
jgi:hypothetical protein